jgi:hypothetical protein
MLKGYPNCNQTLIETDFAGGGPLGKGWPTAMPGYNYTLPNGVVDLPDITAVESAWWTVPQFNQVQVDQPPYYHFVDIYDLSVVAHDYGKTAKMVP